MAREREIAVDNTTKKQHRALIIKHKERKVQIRAALVFKYCV